MLDINFYMKTHGLMKEMMEGKSFDKDFVFNEFEKHRSTQPVVYNIETTNACNMRCKMCPRTTMMTRKVESLEEATFYKIVEQLKPFTKEEWETWQLFAEKEYKISRDDVSENHFFLHIIPKVIQLHGYGAPLLDRNMPKYVKFLSQKGFLSYFSCNPANINIEKTAEMFENGLSYIKYSMETVDDEEHKKIRGKASNFSLGYEKILKLLALKKERNYKTTVVITMLNLNRSKQMDEFKRLLDAFEGLDAYVYLKSEDQQWYRKDYHKTESIHWSELCRHPWMSMTVKSNGEAAMCMEDFNNEIIFGDVKNESLYDIWNGEKYIQFRKDHFNLKKGLKCTEECDMKLVGNMNLQS